MTKCWRPCLKIFTALITTKSPQLSKTVSCQSSIGTLFCTETSSLASWLLWMPISTSFTKFTFKTCKIWHRSRPSIFFKLKKENKCNRCTVADAPPAWRLSYQKVALNFDGRDSIGVKLHGNQTSEPFDEFAILRYCKFNGRQSNEQSQSSTGFKLFKREERVNS
jgi:hypothetical protein